MNLGRPLPFIENTQITSDIIFDIFFLGHEAHELPLGSGMAYKAAEVGAEVPCPTFKKMFAAHLR